ncbi:hypothetical protein V3H38_23000 [Vibrio parahaemolyticus]|uniref:hypothetical protein n=1 Tax=Vibrio parahaemolyticus TaxID=670 RepID=UPI001A1CA187|nr:hypothetical protein [Vibrio parahaemolyticus]EGQ7835440.1 hypothetical protein [Vibrio vulnificus]EKY4197836.1 hypothetical protein [Vibrio harveyi]EKO5172236.1 hypothetical protein [Vibrio vulnificus]WMN64838.1 hypothetical protein NI388_06630 [Vibrio parahaemolyticus]WMN75476.1 hypothetical protein NI386_14710 [Vibrio parahaemolyticus]
MKKFLAIALITGFFTSTSSARTFETVEGGALYLKRFGVETLRAEFTNAEDCELIAKNMSAAEPNVSWYCSTSTDPVALKCNLNDVTVKNTDKGTQTTESIDFKMTMNRGKANTNLTSAISSFDYHYSEPYLMFSNDYPYVDGNYFSRAITKLRLNLETGEIVALDINMSPNGTGHCKQ